MKMYNIFRHASPLAESENLFPGIDSSVFDNSKAKDVKPIDPDNVEAVKAQSQKYSDVMSVYRHHFQQLIDYLDANDAMTYVGYGMSAGPNEVMYASFDWLDKYESVQGRLVTFAISKKSPVFKDIEKYIRKLNSLQGRIDFFGLKISRINNALKAGKKKAKKARTAAASTTFVTFAQNAPHIAAPNPIPNKVLSSTGSKVANPYVHAGASKQYAGHVAHYPHWTPYWKDQIMQIEDILKRNGKAGLEMMYASTHQNGGGRFNFIITGANGKLTWRKYDPSPGAGQNWIILAGKKMNTSSLLDANAARQDKLVASL